MEQEQGQVLELNDYDDGLPWRVDAEPEPARAQLGWMPLLLPVLSATLLTLYATRPRAERPIAVEPRQVEPEESVPAYVGSIEVSPALRLVARLSPLQADVARQTFDSEVLARRLGVSPGEAWRLELGLEPLGSEVDALGASGSESIEFALQGFAVSDDSGRVLETLGVDGGQGDAADPIQALFQAPNEPLVAASRVQLLLWGQAPSSAPKLLLPDGQQCELFDFAVPERELPKSVAAGTQ